MFEVSAPPPAGAAGRAGSRMTREQMQERLPRSAPDALRYEPGVHVQQTAHGQGSAFVRGRTGQQVLLLFDGIRLNTSLFRQGPNQYFFTVDPNTIAGIEVVRGGASTRFGSDAVAGVIDAHPVEPRAAAPGEPAVRPRAFARVSSAEDERGGRLQAEADVLGRVAVLAGAGYREAGLLEGGGIVHALDERRCSACAGDEDVPQVPRLADDDRTQRGTGLREATADARASVALGGGDRLVLAAYDYRQLDTPRTDQCPPPDASLSECLVYEEQFRTLAYAALEGGAGAAARRGRLALSWQRQHERTRHDRVASPDAREPTIFNGARDDVDTFGALGRAETVRWRLLPSARARLRYGGDVWHDRVDSAAWIRTTDVELVRLLPRGQHLAGSRYTHGGAFAEAEVELPGRVTARAGGRIGLAAARAPADPESGTAEVDRAWLAPAGHAGIEWAAHRRVMLIANVDRSFRAPNLSDLTARQQAGPGYQFENPDLGPETARTVEAGARWLGERVEADLWVFRSRLSDAIARALVPDPADCPPGESQCAASWSRFRLVNLREPSTVSGVEAALRARFGRLRALATLAVTTGEQVNPNTGEPEPVSRVPPPSGTLEIRRALPPRAYLGAGLRWALAQDRLAQSDLRDARIPGGTPGYAVLDLRAGYRAGDRLAVTLALENVTDAAYRTHGSSINGPSRGVAIQAEAGW